MDKPSTTHIGRISSAVPGNLEEQAPSGATRSDPAARSVSGQAASPDTHDAHGAPREDGQPAAPHAATLTGSVASALRARSAVAGMAAPASGEEAKVPPAASDKAAASHSGETGAPSAPDAAAPDAPDARDAAQAPAKGKAMGPLRPSDVDFMPGLLRSLSVLLRLRGKAVSPQFLMAGLTGSRVTPQACLRAARKAGLSGRIAFRPVLEDIPTLVLPCILLLT